MRSSTSAEGSRGAFAHGQELAFRIHARRQKAAGLWAADGWLPSGEEPGLMPSL